MKLVVPLHKLDHVLRNLSIVHLHYLVDFTEEDEVDVGKLVAGQVSISLQKLVYLQQTLFILSVPQFKILLSFWVTGRRNLLRRK